MRYYRIIGIILWAFFFMPPSNAQEKQAQEDHFAQIGNRAQATRIHLLEDKYPPVLPDVYLPEMKGKRSAFMPIDKMDSSEELQVELAQMRDQFVPFMANYAPPIAETRKQVQLSEFQWRIETTADQQNFSETLSGKGKWTTVKIPHFGPPEGRSTTYYYKEIELP